MSPAKFIALLALLGAGPAQAVAQVATNRMPESFHAQMESAGHNGFHSNLGVMPAGTNSLKQLPPVDQGRLLTLAPADASKPGWSFWKNAGIKYVGRNSDPINFLAPSTLVPYSALSKFEYDIAYSFDF